MRVWVGTSAHSWHLRGLSGAGKEVWKFPRAEVTQIPSTTGSGSEGGLQQGQNIIQAQMKETQASLNLGGEGTGDTQRRSRWGTVTRAIKQGRASRAALGRDG